MTAVTQLQEWLSSHLTHEQQMQFEGLFQQAKEMELNLSKVKRFEVINHTKNNLEIGRVLTTRGFTSLEASIQDGGCTLKIFIS